MDILLSFMIRLLVWLSSYARFLSRFHLSPYDEWQPGKKLKILIVGYNGARNTGADARVVAIVQQIKEVFGQDAAAITVMTLNEKTLEGYFDEDVTLLPFSSIFPLPLYKACCSHHVAVISEGSTLKSTFANALTLFFCEASGIMSRQKKPCIAYGSEAGAMEPVLQKAAKDLCRDTYFITRTKESLEIIEKLGLKGHVGTDTAWTYRDSISPEEAESLLRQQGWDGKKKLLGAAVINPFCWPVRASFSRWIRRILTGDTEGCYDKWYFFSDSEERREAFRLYLQEIASAVRTQCEKEDCFPVVIGMERLDEEACLRLQEMLPDSALFPAKDHTASVMSGILKHLDLLVTSRYHASVLSMEAALPIVAVSMDERLDSIFRELSLDSRYLYHVNDENLCEKILYALTMAEEHREEIREIIQSNRRQYQEKLADMGLFLKNYIEENLNRRTK